MNRRPALRLVSLEDRLAPATFTWTGGGGANTNWTSAANWDNEVGPRPGDSLVFPAGVTQTTSVNNYAAGTSFNDIRIEGSGYEISGNAVSLTAGIAAAIPLGGTSTMSLAIDGAGGLTMAGAGTLVLTGPNSYSGLTSVSIGTLSVGSNNALGAVGAGNGTLVDTDGVLLVSGVNTPEPVTFGLLSANNTSPLLGGSADATLSGPLTLDQTSRFVSQTARLTIAGSVEAFGRELSLHSSSSAAPIVFAPGSVYENGNITIDLGLVLFNGVHNHGFVAINNADVGGTGSVGMAGVVSVLNARILPGDNGIGTLTTGDFSLPPQSTPPDATGPGFLIIDLLDGTNDQLRVLGTLDLGGVLTVNATFSPTFLPAPGMRYRIIDNQGPSQMFSKFANLPEGAIVEPLGALDLRITYVGGDGNDVELIVIGATDVPAFAVGAGPGTVPTVNVYGSDGTLVRTFNAYEASFRGGVRVATADMTGDGAPDVITVPGAGGGPVVRIWDGMSGAMIREFNAYDPAFRGGVFLATARIDLGDQVPDIITGAGAGGGPHVKVFNGASGAVISSFLAYDPQFSGGVSVAGLDSYTPDINGPRQGWVVTGPGPGGGPHVRAFIGDSSAQPVLSFLAYDPQFLGGVNVAAGITGFGTLGRGIVTAPGAGGGPDVREYGIFFNNAVPNGGFQIQLGPQFLAYGPAFLGGVNVALLPLGLGGANQIITGAGPGGGPHVRTFFTDGTPNLSFFPFDPTFLGGVFVG